VSESICYTDAYAKAVDALVTAVQPPPAEGSGVLVALDRTVFYPGGGGQPPDRGRLIASDGHEWAVRAARKSGDDIVHELEPWVSPPASTASPP